MSTTPTGTRRGRGGLGKYLRARGRRGGGRPAEFGQRLRLEEDCEVDGDTEGSGEDEDGKPDKYARRELGTNVDRYKEPEVDPHSEETPEPEVDLTSFLAKQRLADERDNTINKGKEHDEIEEVDHSLSNLPSTSSSTSRMHKNKVQTIEWDASLDELRREKEAAEAVWDLKSRFRKHQPRLLASSAKPSRGTRPSAKVEDSRHVPKPLDPDTETQAAGAKSSRTEMEGFLDDLLS